MNRKTLTIATVAAILGAATAALAQSLPVSYTFSGVTQQQDAGITAARNAYNAAYPGAQLASNQAYIQFVDAMAVQSYCSEYAISGC